MPLPPLHSISQSQYYITGNVIIDPSAAIAPGVILQADPDSKIIIASGVCIGMGSIIHAHSGLLKVDAGAMLGSGVLVVGKGNIGANSCIGATTTIYNTSLPSGEIVPPGTLLGDLGRIITQNEEVIPPPQVDQPVTESITEKVIETVTESIIENVIETVTASITENVIETAIAIEETIKITTIEDMEDPWDANTSNQVPIEDNIANQTDLNKSSDVPAQISASEEKQTESSSKNINSATVKETESLTITNSAITETESLPTETENKASEEETKSPVAVEYQQSLRINIYGQGNLHRLLGTLFPHRQ
jgi:carbon dioxide concentrating mechanism protein CcmN